MSAKLVEAEKLVIKTIIQIYFCLFNENFTNRNGLV